MNRGRGCVTNYRPPDVFRGPRVLLNRGLAESLSVHPEARPASIDPKQFAVSRSSSRNRIPRLIRFLEASTIQRVRGKTKHHEPGWEFSTGRDANLGPGRTGGGNPIWPKL